MATIKNSNDLVLQSSTIRVTDTTLGVGLDLSGFSGFNNNGVDEFNNTIYTPIGTSLNVVSPVAGATYIWTLEGASYTSPSYTDTISVEPLGDSTEVTATVTTIPPGFPHLKFSIYGDSLSAGSPPSIPSSATDITLVSNGLFTVTDYSVGGTTSENARLGTGFFVPPYVSFANQMSTRDTADYVLIRYGI
ncbi:MAG: hypothetical protein QX189_20015, partial [Methylococcales bacterium]